MSGIPKSQEIKRIVDNVTRIQEKAKENAKSAEGVGEAEIDEKSAGHIFRDAGETMDPTMLSDWLDSVSTIKNKEYS